MSIWYIVFLFSGVFVLCLHLYSRRWKEFDSSWLLELALEQYPEDTKLHNSIKKCTRIRGDHFVSAENPNKPGSEWQFDRSVTLIHPEMDDIILDVLKDGRIGGIEYLGLMCQK